MGDLNIVTELDTRPDYYSGGENSINEGPAQPEEGFSGVMTGTLATQRSADLNLVTRDNLQVQPSSAVPGLVSNRQTEADAGLGFASLVSNFGAISKQALDITNKFAPKQTAQVKGVLNQVPGLPSYNNTPTPAKTGVSALVLVGAAFAAGVALFLVTRKG